jgi:hypothetical protein
VAGSRQPRGDNPAIGGTDDVIILSHFIECAYRRGRMGEMQGPRERGTGDVRSWVLRGSRATENPAIGGTDCPLSWAATSFYPR